MAGKPKGNKTLVEQAKNKRVEQLDANKKENGVYVNFKDIKHDFEYYIAQGLSEANSAYLCNIHPQTIQKHKERNPEYKDTLDLIKENVGIQARLKLAKMIQTGDTPVGELSASEYRKALEFFIERHKSTKGDYTKTEHKIIETIKEVDATTLQKVNEVFQVVDVESDDSE